MSLLDTASLLLTPNAYKEGKLYSVIPFDGSGDFTFTRATTATRVNSDGLVELVPYNLLQRSQEFENGIWSNVNTTDASNTATAPDGTLTADSLIATVTNASHYIVQSFTALTNTFTISVYAKANGYNGIRINAGASGLGYASFDLANVVNGGGGTYYISSTMTDVGNGWFRVSATFASQAGAQALIAIENTYQNVVFAGNGTDGLFIWGAQLVEGTNALPYQKTETRLNIPRLDYSLGGCPSILLEPQRTNLALQSSSFDNATWTKSNTTIVANNTISPSGVQDADLIYPTTTGSTRFAFQSASGASTTYTLSVYAKAQNKSVVWLYVNSSGSFGSVFFDLANGTLQVVAGSISTPVGKIEYLDNGWYKCSITPSSTFSLSNAGIGVADTLGNFTVSNNGTDGIYLWGAQLEAGAYATSYIPTTTASVTRNNEICEKLSISSLIGQSEGTLYFEGSNIGAFTEICNINRSTTNSVWFISQSDQTLRATIYANGTAVTINSSVLTTSIFKAAIAYKTNSIAFYVNGVLIGQNMSATFTPNVAMENLYVNQGGYLGVKNKVNAKAVALWKERLTNDQLAQLTTI